MPSPVKLAHVVLYSRQIPVMRDWYLQVLEGHVVHEMPGGVFLTYDDEHHRIAIFDPVALQEAAGQALEGDAPVALTPEQIDVLPPHGLAHIAFTYRSLQDLLENWERLKNESVLPVIAINHGPTTSMYYSDPDGNQLELQIDNFASPDEGTAFMESESFAKNPIGVVFDPETMIDRLRAGEPAAALTAPTW